MGRRRYTEDQLTPVHRVMTETYRRRNDPSAGTRRECWEALSADDAGEPDGLWSYARFEEPGSPWGIQHLPTGFAPVAVQWSNLDDARNDTRTGRIWTDLWAGALWLLDSVREHSYPDFPISHHDRARAFLTWAVEHGHAPTEAPARLDPVMVTG